MILSLTNLYLALELKMEVKWPAGEEVGVEFSLEIFYTQFEDEIKFDYSYHPAKWNDVFS